MEVRQPLSHLEGLFWSLNGGAGGTGFAPPAIVGNVPGERGDGGEVEREYCREWRR